MPYVLISRHDLGAPIIGPFESAIEANDYRRNRVAYMRDYIVRHVHPHYEAYTGTLTLPDGQDFVVEVHAATAAQAAHAIYQRLTDRLIDGEDE